MSGKKKVEERLKHIGLPLVPVKGDTHIQKWDNALKKFTAGIEHQYQKNKQSQEEFEKKLIIVEEIESYLARNVFNKKISGVNYELKAVVPFGSSASGLGVKSGDLDMTVCVHPALVKREKFLVQTRKNAILFEIFNHITSGHMLEGRQIENMEHLSHVRVPIITGLIDGINVDIGVSMTATVDAQYLSSKFIDAYAKYDRRFILLAAFAKQWQKSMKTSENEGYFKTVFPSSCSTVLLVVFFMKYYGLLPDINKKHNDKLGMITTTWKMVCQGENGAFGIPNSDVYNWKQINSFDVSLGTLFLLFLDFYTNVIDLKYEKIHIASGKTTPKGKMNSKKRIYIMDVIDRDNPARNVSEIPVFKTMYRQAQSIIKHSEKSANIMSCLLNMQLQNPSNIEKNQKNIEKRLLKLGYPRNHERGGNIINKYDRLLREFTNRIEQDYRAEKQSPREFQTKREILNEIADYLEDLFDEYKISGVDYELKAVVPFGSSASALGMAGGDLDLIVCVYPALNPDDKEIKLRSNAILSSIHRAMEKKEMLENRDVELEHIKGASVPILTGTIDDVDVDISVSMVETVSAQYMASKLIDAYEKYDRRVIHLAALVKKWHKSHMGEGDKNEKYYSSVFPNSCSTVLMVIFFMRKYGMLPDIVGLHKDKLNLFSVSWRMVNQGENGAFGIPSAEVQKWKLNNYFEVSVGTLFLLYLDFYSNVVNLTVYKLDMKNGCIFSKFYDDDRKNIIIEDVFDKRNPASSVCNIPVLQSIYSSAADSIRDSYGIDLNKKLFSSVLHAPNTFTPLY